MTTNVREARSSDAAWFIGYVRALTVEPDVKVPLGLDEFTVTHDQQAEIFAGAEARGDLFLIAEVAGARVGELSLRRGVRSAFKHSALLGMSVAPEWRKQRVGSALMQRSLEWARERGDLCRIELFVYANNEPAIRLYRNFGFVEEGRRKGAIRVGNERVDDLIMAHYVNQPWPGAKVSANAP